MTDKYEKLFFFIRSFEELFEKSQYGIQKNIIRCVLSLISITDCDYYSYVLPDHMNAFAWFVKSVQIEETGVQELLIKCCNKVFIAADAEKKLDECRDKFNEDELCDGIDQIYEDTDKEEVRELIDKFKSDFFRDDDD